MQSRSTGLTRKPLKDEVFDVLHGNILSGRYPAGAWLRQEEISRRLGVSMTPVREALDLLVSSGLAERVAYRGVRVLRPGGPDVLDSYEMRLLLEAAASTGAAVSVSMSQLSYLHKLLGEAAGLVSLQDLPREREMSRVLHTEIARAGGNVLLHHTYVEVLRTFPDWLLYEHLYRHPELLEESLRREHDEHECIVDAIGAHDPELAMRRALEHVTHRGRELEQYLGIPRRELEARETRVRHVLGTTNVPAEMLDKEAT